MRNIEILNAIADRFMRNVYCPITACIWYDDSGKICDMSLFDSHMFEPEFKKPVNATQCSLISSHSDGFLFPYDQDILNYAHASESVCEGKCRMYLFFEDEGVKACSVMKNE